MSLLSKPLVAPCLESCAVHTEGEHTLGAVTLTMVNAISHGKLSHGASHLGFSIPCLLGVTRYEDYRGKTKSHAIHWREI